MKTFKACYYYLQMWKYRDWLMRNLWTQNDLYDFIIKEWLKVEKRPLKIYFGICVRHDIVQ